MSETVEGQVTYTADDFVRHTTYMQNRNFIVRNAVFFALTVFGCILLFFYLLNPAKFTITFTKPQNILVLVIPTLLLIAWWFLKKKSPRFLLRRGFEKQINSSPALRDSQFIIFDDEGLYATSRLGSGQTKWDAMVEVTETEEDFLFFTTNKFAQFVPKRFFTDEQLDQIKNIAKRNLGERAKF
jgi:hypothetical protein